MGPPGLRAAPDTVTLGDWTPGLHGSAGSPAPLLAQASIVLDWRPARDEPSQRLAATGAFVFNQYSDTYVYFHVCPLCL